MGMQPGLSSVLTFNEDGSQVRYLGQLGTLAGLAYGWSLPGGPDQMQCTLQVPAQFRTDALNPGRICQVIRGGAAVWEGKLDEPTPSPAGWTITAHGAGTYGADFADIWTTWTDLNDDINQAITRGLRWVNPGITLSGLWTGQQIDSGSETITDRLNLLCTKGNATWLVTVTSAGNILSVIALPTAPDRVLIASGPVARTLGGFINTLWIRYQSGTDGQGAAVFALTSVNTPGSTGKHGVVEAFVDLSSAGNMTAGSAQTIGTNILLRYQKISFAGPFTVRYGELLTLGGQPVDLGAEQAGHVCKLIMTDYGYGGEVVPDPVTFVIGAYSYDDQAEIATVTPFQSIDQSLSGLLGLLGTTLRTRAPWQNVHGGGPPYGGGGGPGPPGGGGGPPP